MSKLIEKLLEILIADCRSKSLVNEQKVNEKVMLVRGRDQGLPAWHYILVPLDNLESLKRQPRGGNIDVEDFGHILQYQDENGNVQSASGWGKNPPRHLQRWLGDQLNDPAIGKDTTLSYSEDDIRLCTILRSQSTQLLGIYREYWKPKKFHYMTLITESRSSLAYRAGIKNYDRIITFNGVNIEEETFEQYQKIFSMNCHLPVQMLLCSPATYAHCKSQNRPIHIGLDTVKYLRPVTGIVDEDSETILPATVAEKGDFCAIKWEISQTVSVVHKSALEQSSDKLLLFDTCSVKTDQGYRRGQLIWKGTREDCEILEGPMRQQNLVKSSSTITLFEHMPNELLMSVFDYVKDSNTSFRGLNRRIDNILQPMKYGSFTIDDLEDALVPAFSHLLTRLVVKTTKPINFKCFSTLRSLSLKTGTQAQLEQIQPNTMPHLTYLSLSMPFYCPLSDLNSGRLQRDANLTDITMIYDRPWSETDCPHSISIDCSHLDAVSFILNECPKIKRLRLEMFTGIDVHPSNFPSSNFKLRSYPVKDLVIKDEGGVLPLECLDTFLSHLPNVEDVELRLFSLCFTDVAKVIAKRLINLRKFRCTMVDCSLDDPLIDIEEIRCLHPMFRRIQLKISQKKRREINLTFFLSE